jgi:hypothetical protein
VDPGEMMIAFQYADETKIVNQRTFWRESGEKSTAFEQFFWFKHWVCIQQQIIMISCKIDEMGNWWNYWINGWRAEKARDLSKITCARMTQVSEKNDNSSRVSCILNGWNQLD